MRARTERQQPAWRRARELFAAWLRVEETENTRLLPQILKFHPFSPKIALYAQRHFAFLLATHTYPNQCSGGLTLVQIPKPGKGGKFWNLNAGVELRKFAPNVFIRGFSKRRCLSGLTTWCNCRFFKWQSKLDSPYPLSKCKLVCLVLTKKVMLKYQMNLQRNLCQTMK